MVGQDPPQWDWRQPPAGQILHVIGDPNGELTAPKSTLAAERDEPGLWQNTDGETTWRKFGGNPSSFGFLRANEDGSGTGIANATFHTLTFSVVGGDTSGTDISIDTGVPTFNADGVYSIMLWIGAISDAAADTFNWVQLQLSIDRAGPRHGPTLVHGFFPAVDAANKHYGEAAITPTLFCPATSTLEIKAKMAGGGAGTWSVFVGALHIDRVG